MIADSEVAALLEVLAAGGHTLKQAVSPTADLDGIAAASGSISISADARIDWAHRNRKRIDLEVLDSQRRQRVVIFTDEVGLIESVESWRRPERADPLARGLAVVLDGPSSSGKSSVLKALRQLDSRPWITFDEPWLGEIAPAYLIWPDAAPSVHRGFLDGIAALAMAGNLIAMSLGGASHKEVDAAFAEVDTVWARMACDPNVRLAREAKRADRRGGLAISTSASTHSHDIILDSTDVSPEALAARLLDQVEARLR